MKKSRSLPGRPQFPRVRVVPLHDPKQIALREKRLGIQLTEKERVKRPSEVFAEIDELFGKHPTNKQILGERQMTLEQNLMTALELARRTAEGAAMLQNDVPEFEDPYPPDQLFQSLDDMAEPSRGRSTDELKECGEQMSMLIEKVAHIDAVLQADIETEFFSEVEDTPAEVVAKNPGPAIEAARKVPDLFKDLDSQLPRSKLKAYDVLLRAGAVEVHRYVEEKMTGALSRRDEGIQWAQKVLSRKDRHPPGHSQWCKRALAKLESERDARRVYFGLGQRPENVFK